MTLVAIYRTSDGLILRFVSCPPDQVSLQCGEGEEFYLNCPESATHILDNEPEIVEPAPVTPSLAQAKTDKKAELATARYAEEVGGITVNGVAIKTDRESRYCLDSVRDDLVSGMYSSTKFKTADGEWIDVTAATIAPVHEAVHGHVRTCFLKECSLVAQVDSATTVAGVTAITW